MVLNTLLTGTLTLSQHKESNITKIQRFQFTLENQMAQKIESTK
jgi:hypothetical protein